MATEKRVRFQSLWLPYLLVLPQIVVTVVFFFWPAMQAIYSSVMQEDTFGATTTFIGLENFRALFHDDTYLNSMRITVVFSALVAVIGLSVSLLLATMADRVVRGAAVYKTLLIWPYAVAPAIAAVLWLFLFSPSLGIISHALARLGIRWDHLLNDRQAVTLIVIAAVWKQISYNFLFFLAGLQSIPR